MLAHGINHGRSLDGTARWFERVGFGSPQINARLSSIAEVAIGLGLIAGFLTPVAAAGLVSVMVVAFWSIHRFAGFFVFHRPDEGYEYVATLAVLALGIAIVGPGRLSVDATIGLDLDGATGAIIYALGIVAGVGQLVVFWRRPDKKDA